MEAIKLPYEPEAVRVYTPDEGVDIIIKECINSDIASKKQGKHTYNYYNVYAAFDIETTKLLNIDFQQGMTNMYKYFNYTYCWQFMINDYFIFGRSIDDFFKMIHKASKHLDAQLICYIHNMAFEYNNLADYFGKSRAFFRNASVPLYIVKDSVEFRCSAQLTHKPLAKLGPKLKGDLDYSIERDESTPLTPLELNYCYRDVKIIVDYIRSETSNYCKRINKAINPCYLPLTSTGYVRNDMKKYFSSTKGGHTILHNCELLENDYLFISNAFYGAFTHANFRYIGYEFKRSKGEIIRHFDLVSAYLWAMIGYGYPRHLTPVPNCSKYMMDEMLKKDHMAVIAHLTLVNPRLKAGHVPYIPYSKDNDKMQAFSTHKDGVVSENGKLITIIDGAINITLCDVDIKLIYDNYEIDEVIVNKVYHGIKRPLPYAVVNVVLSYFEKKTSLKDVAGKEFEYNFSKSQANSCYGMCAQALINEEYEITEDLRVISTGSKYTPSKIVPYQWAIYITAYVRNIIYGLISKLSKVAGKHAFIYSDTDSLFCLDTPEFITFVNDYNAEVKAKLHQLQLRYFNAIPCNPKGEPQYLGLLLEEDEDIDRFCTIGAKRYYITDKRDVTSVTFSGLRATKPVYQEATDSYINGFNTQRLIDRYGSIHNAFKEIVKGAVELPYVEGVDKLSNYNVRAPFRGILKGREVKRPCSFTLYPMATTLSLNATLKTFMQDHLYNDLY